MLIRHTASGYAWQHLGTLRLLSPCRGRRWTIIVSSSDIFSRSAEAAHPLCRQKVLAVVAADPSDIRTFSDVLIYGRRP